MRKVCKVKGLILVMMAMIMVILQACDSGDTSSEVTNIVAATNEQHTSGYIYSAALAEELRKNEENPIEMEVLSYSGGIGNAELVKNGEADVGIMFNISSNWAYNGTVAYDEKYED